MSDLDIITADLRYHAPRSDYERGFNEGVDRLVERVAEVDHWHKWTCADADCGIDQPRFTLAATPASDGLDVERLARAMGTVYEEDIFFARRKPGEWDYDAQCIAAEYARLSPSEGGESR